MNKICIVGCGAAAEKLHIPALMKMENVHISSIVDVDIERAREMASRFNVQIGADEIIPAEGVNDIAVVTVPTGLHKEVSIKCLKAGYHVLCEKPMASNYEEAKEMIQTSDELRKKLAVGMARRFLPHNILVKKWVKNGAFGIPKAVHFEEGGAFSWPVKTLARFDPVASGGGAALNGTGSHLLDMVLWWFEGKIEFKKYTDDFEGGIDANCKIEFNIKKEGNVLPVTGLISMTGPLDNLFKIYFNEGFLSVPIFANSEIKFFPHSESSDYFSIDPYLNSRSEHDQLCLIEHLNNFIQFINGNEEANYISGESQIKLMKLIDKAYKNRSKFTYEWM